MHTQKQLCHSDLVVEQRVRTRPPDSHILTGSVNSGIATR